MALDTREVAKAQVRGYTTIENVSATTQSIDLDKFVFAIDANVGNCGQSPARDVEVFAKIAGETAFSEPGFIQDIPPSAGGAVKFIATIKAGNLAFRGDDHAILFVEAGVKFRDVSTRRTENKIVASQFFLTIFHLVKWNSQKLSSAGPMDWK